MLSKLDADGEKVKLRTVLILVLMEYALEAEIVAAMVTALPKS